LWLFPFGLLVYRSRFLPRILGVWLMLNCFAYLATSVTSILWPQYQQRVSNWVFPVMFGELAIMLWLVFMVRKSGSPRRPPPDPGD
jgi:FtsH-binding integral membrane protein